MKFIYTEAALQELQAYQGRQQKLLEEMISERKFVYGDDAIEVTASDIKEAAEFIRPYRPQVLRYSSVRLVSQVYLALGAVITIGAFFYPTFENIFRENRVQAMAIGTGVIMMLLGAFAGYRYRTRIRRYQDMERMYYLRNDK